MATLFRNTEWETFIHRAANEIFSCPKIFPKIELNPSSILIIVNSPAPACQQIFSYRLPARFFFCTMIEPYTKIYFCRLQVRLGQIIILSLLQLYLIPYSHESIYTWIPSIESLEIMNSSFCSAPKIFIKDSLVDFQEIQSKLW